MTELKNLPVDQVFKTVPFQHQVEGLMISRNEPEFALLMEMGTGKTKIAIDTAAYLFAKGKINGLIVVAPKSICRNWSHKEIPVHLADNIERHVVLWGADNKKLKEDLEQLWRPDPLRLHILVMNIEAVPTDRGYDTVEKFLLGHDTLMVIDESTIIKNHKAERTKIMLKLGKHAKYRRIMTGTPVTQSPLDVYSQFEFLRHGCLGSTTYYGFRTQYANLARKRVNGREFDVVVGYKRLDQLQAVLKPLSFRALKKDCLDLPDKIYEVRNVELTTDQKKYYKSFVEDAMAILNNGDVVAAPLVLTQLLRLRQCLCNIAPKSNLLLREGESSGEFQEISKEDPRSDEVFNILEEAGDQKAIIWANFVPSIKRLERMFNEKFGPESYGCIYGEISQEERQNVVTRFQNPQSPLRYIIAQPRTGGYGLTLTAASLVIYHDQDWSLEVRQQSEDRAHRIGQKNNVTYIDLIAPGTIDEKIREALMSKKNLADMVTGDTLKNLLRAS